MSVALRKESVDRNPCHTASVGFGAKSLSARRAWIEIEDNYDLISCDNVALRKESVDRNDRVCKADFLNAVALRKESVDRNSRCTKDSSILISRSPQGERG